MTTLRLRSLFTIASGLLVLPASAQVQRDVTFFFTGDPQYEVGPFGGCKDDNPISVITQMNLFQNGDKDAPSLWGGKVPRPRGVLIGGDLIQNGGEGVAKEDNQYQCLIKDWFFRVTPDSVYPTGINLNKLLAYPVLEGLGNHDQNNPGVDGSGLDSYTPTLVKWRNTTRDSDVFFEGGGPESLLVNYSYSAEGCYAWTWDDVRFVQLHEYAAGARHNTPRARYARNALKFLACDLAAHASNGEPVVIVKHYRMQEYSQEEWDDLWTVVKNYNVIVMFSGHHHGSECFTWNGNFIGPCNTNYKNGPHHLVYGCCGGGADPSSPFGFLVVRILDDEIRVAGWRSKNVGDAPEVDGMGKEVWDWDEVRQFGYPDFAPPVPNCGPGGDPCGCDDFGSYCGPLGYANGGGYQGIVDEIAAAQCGYGTPLVDVQAGTYASPAGAETLSGPAVLRPSGGTVIID